MSKQMSNPKTLASLAILASTLGCVNPANSDSAEKNNVVSNDTTPTKEQRLEVPMAMNVQEQTTFATQSLAKKLSVAKSKISLLTVQSVNWRTSAIGCPRSGEHSMQVLTPGVLIVLAADGKHYRYHAKRFGEPFYCEAERAESPATENSEI
jgi:hypothetical protein